MNRFDVAVIGGGIAGTSAAFFLAENASVVVLEAETTLGFHSTGRSAAVFTECYGEPVVRNLALASRGFLTSPPDGFTDVPLLSPRGIAFVATPDQADRLEPSLAEQQQLVPSVRGLSAREAADLCPVLDPAEIVGGVLEPDARDLDVHALHMGYQRGIRRHDGEIRTGFAVDRLERRDEAWTIACGDDEVEAGVVIDAAGAWCDVVAAAAGVDPIGLVPKRRTAFTFDPPSGMEHRDWPMIIDIDEQFYFKPEGPSLLASPADETQVEPHDVRHREQDVALGIERIQSVTTLSIRSIRNAWAGLRSFVADNRPVNGWDPAVPGFYWLAGQGGFGIKTSPAMGRYAASMILDGDPPADLGIDRESLGVERLQRSTEY
jgi:D-arginine dehydrogenase